MSLFDRILAVTRKELAHIWRDKFTLVMALGFPVMMVMVFGVAFEFNLNNIPLAVHDADKTATSRMLIETFASSGFFHIEHVPYPGQVIRELDGERARVGIIIEPQFERGLRSGMGGSVQILVDGADNTTAGSVLGYLESLQKLATERLTEVPGGGGLKFKTRFLFNHELRTRWFIVPGLSVVVLAVLSVLLTSLTVAREWENGSMELLLATPVRPVEIIIGKLLPYIALGLGAVVFIYLAARVVFGVPFLGSHLLYALACLMFVATCSMQGILISVVTRVQQISMQAAILSGLLPSLLLSGFVYPIESMPRFFYYFSMILPARWFMQISREIYLKGSTLAELKVPFMALALICLFMTVVAAKKFKKDVEP